jgi:hypothetical protein
LGTLELFAAAFLKYAPLAIQAGQTALDVLEQGSAKVAAIKATGADPTQADWDDINARMAAVTAAIDTQA